MRAKTGLDEAFKDFTDGSKIGDGTIGRKIRRIEVGFFRRGEMRADLYREGKTPAEKEQFARFIIKTENTEQ